MKQHFIDFIEREGETFKSIPDYPSYSISDFGRVKIGQYEIVPNTKCGYSVVTLRNEGGRGKNFLVHRLVASSFLENPLNKPEVDHIDTNKSNNALSNLRWVWHLENMIGNKITCSKLNDGYKKKVIYESIRLDLYYSSKSGVEVLYDEETKDIVKNTIGETCDNLLSTLMPSNFGKKTIDNLIGGTENDFNNTTLLINIDDIHTGMKVKVGRLIGEIISVNSLNDSVTVMLKDGSKSVLNLYNIKVKLSS